jgi:biopolymer transport protein ExbD
MKKYLVLLIAFGIVSCEGKKEIQLPKADRTIIGDVKEHSPIYIFFKVEGKDTIADVNRKNAIVSTNWIFNIDKRLPLKLVMPELIKLQAKKDKSIHKNEAAENYFSYANDKKKTLAFLPFASLKFKIEKPKSGVEIYFTKGDKVLVDKTVVEKSNLINYLDSLESDKPLKYNFCFDKEASYDTFIKNAVFTNTLEIEMIISEIYIF